MTGVPLVITREDLQAAIAECQGKRNPDASTCIKLAAFYTIKEYMFPEHKEEAPQQSYSYGAPPNGEIYFDSDTEFANSVNGRSLDEVMIVVDEAMTALQVLNPPFYASIIRKIKQV